MRFIKTYWLELLVFGAVLAVLMIDVAPSPTWCNTDCDGIHDTYAASNLYLAHKTSMPLYLLIGHLFTMIPFGTDFWNLALLSVFATLGACVFIYLSIRHYLKDNHKSRWYALIGVLIYGGSALVISQSTIVETYALVSMLGIGAYYFYIKQKWYLCALLLGLGLAVHPLAGIPLIILFIYGRELRRIKPILIIGACLLLYLYIPLSPILRPEQPNMWGNQTIPDMLRDLLGTYQFLFASLAIYDLPKRILDTIGIVGVSLGLALIPITWYLWKNKKRELFWLFLLPIIMFVIGLPPQTCFPKGTIILAKKLIRAANNKWFYAPMPRKIEDIKVGDEVLSYNEKTGEKEYKKVTHLFNSKAQETVLVKLSNDNEFRCTVNHPIAVNRKGRLHWVQAGKLQIDDELIQYKYRAFNYRLSSIRARGLTPEERYGEKAAQFREKCRQTALEQWADPNNGINSPEHHRKISEGNKKSWRNPLSLHNSEHRKQLRSEYMKKNNPYNNLESREKLRKTRKKQWADSAFARKMFMAWQRKPNKSEMILGGIIKEISPDFKYNGYVERGIVIGGRIPDFVNINGKKKVIELYGTYWHRGENAQNKINHYAKYGYDCLVVWEKELKTPEVVKDKINDFIYNPNTEIVKVIAIKKVKSEDEEAVYNLEVADNNNYFAYGILVHNCVYVVPSIAVGSVIAALGLSKMRRCFVGCVAVMAIALLGFNAHYFDIGRTLDPELSATKYYEEELDKVPDGAILMPKQGWEWTAIFAYNKENDRNIVPVATMIFTNETYQQYLIENGIKFEDNYADDRIERENYLALSIVRLNENVWTTRATTPETYGCEVIPASGNEQYLINIPTEEPGMIHWKPSNPYKFITGALEVEEWTFITLSNWNVGFFLSLGTLGFILNWLLFILPKKRVLKDESIEIEKDIGITTD